MFVIVIVSSPVMATIVLISKSQVVMPSEWPMTPSRATCRWSFELRSVLDPVTFAIALPVRRRNCGWILLFAMVDHHPLLVCRTWPPIW